MMTMSLLMTAQRPSQGPGQGPSRERIEAQRVAFITQRLSLTPDEAAKFWPVYNEHKDALKALRDDMERPDLANVTDEEANTIIERHLVMEDKRLQLKKDLIRKLRVVVPSRKILMLHAAERDFNKDLLRRANEMRRQ